MRKHQYSIVRIIFTVLIAVSYVFAANPYGKHSLITYIVDWEVPPNIQWSKIDHAIYSFGEPNSKGQLESFSASSLSNVVKQAHAHGVGVSLAVGGWTGSKYFSTLVNPAHRAGFVTNLVNTVKHYNLDGLNIDWEFPNSGDGVACNARNAKDTANYFSFLQLLRKQLDKAVKNKKVILTAATAIAPFNDASGNPSKSVAEFAKVLDYVLIMSYDINGDWNSVAAPNAPLFEPGHGVSGSGSSGVAAWKKAGFPANRIHLGVPFYGWTTKIKTNVAKTGNFYVPFSNPQIKGDQYDSSSADPCKGAKASYSGEMQYRSVVADGILTSKNGWKYFYDKHTVTSWGYNLKKQQWVTFDDTRSAAAKAKWAKQNKLAGVMIWSLEMDHDGQLINALQAVRH